MRRADNALFLLGMKLAGQYAHRKSWGYALQHPRHTWRLLADNTSVTALAESRDGEMELVLLLRNLFLRPAGMSIFADASALLACLSLSRLFMASIYGSLGRWYTLGLIVDQVTVVGLSSLASAAVKCTLIAAFIQGRSSQHIDEIHEDNESVRACQQP
jgi:hypothetical protein